MSKFAILYWEPGSCGDFVYSTLLAKPEEYCGVVDFSTVNDQGRAVPRIIPFYKDNFKHDPKQWYLRTWTTDDINALSAINQQNQSCLVIPTHRLDQVEFLKSHLVDAVTVGITYTNNMFPLVLKNWCKKVAPGDKGLQKIYDLPQHEYLRRKNSFGEFVLGEQLKFGSRIRHSVDSRFDTNIPLEELYSKNLSTLRLLFQDSSHVDDMFCNWIKHQSIVHQHQYKIPEILQKALGHNLTSQLVDTLDVELDSFDNILIKHQKHPVSIPHFKTLQQAADFFKS